MFTKKQTKKYLFLDEWQAISCEQFFFCVEPTDFLKISSLNFGNIAMLIFNFNFNLNIEDEIALFPFSSAIHQPRQKK